MAFDTVQGRTVLFGGTASQPLNGVWQYDTATDRWLQLEPAQGCPSGFAAGRAGDALEYDPLNQLFWMFGRPGFGCTDSARIAGKGTTTTAIRDETLPATTVDFYKGWTVTVGDTSTIVSAYNPATKTLTLATPLAGAHWWSPYVLSSQRGGGTLSYSAVTKSWGTSTGSEPANRLSPAMAYSTRGAAIVMFGGQGLSDTWALDVRTKSWRQMIPGQAVGSPPGLAELSNSMVYDSDNDVFVLFGGCRCTGDVGPSSGDTWAYRLSTNSWTKMTPAVSPPPRQGHNLVYDSANKVVVLFGGVDVPSARYYNDLWIYSYATNTWTQVFPSVSPLERRGGAMVYDPVHQRTILYGGTSHASFHDVWALQLQGPSPGNPAPTLTSLLQDSAVAGGSPFTLAVTGANFAASSVVRWNGVSRPTTYVRSTQLQASISATDIASVGTAQVTVVTPTPGGGSSNSLPFAVTAPLPAPTLTSITPTSATAGGGAFTVTATGTNFASTSVLRINGSNRPTTVVSVTQLTTTILASDVAAAGALSISVLTPAPGGGTSASRTLTVSAVLVPPPTPVPVAAPTPVPAPPPTPLPPTVIPGTFLGATGEDKVGPGTHAAPNGTPDWHLRLTGVASDPVSVNVDSFKAGTLIGRWNVPVQPNNWIVSKSFAGGTLHLWIEPFLAPDSFTVTVVYADGTSAIAANILPPTPIPTPAPAPAPTTTPVPVPTPTPSGGASPGTVWVRPGDPLPVRQWVERLNGVSGQAGDVCNPAGVWVAESCGLAPGKESRAVYHPGLRGLVLAGGDHPVGMPHPGYADGTGTEVTLYEALTDKWTTLRPFCVPGEIQPQRPDEVMWALDARRNRAIMAQGFYMGDNYFPGSRDPGAGGPSGCGAIEGMGGYAFDFATRKYIGPDDPSILSVPPGGWPGDNGGHWAVVDPTNDEFLYVRNGVGLQRMNLATKAWRTTPLLLTPWVSQLVIDVQGRAVYYIAPYGTNTILPDGNIDQAPLIVKVFLDDPNGRQEFIRLPWPFQGFSGEGMLAFDPGNRVLFVPNNIANGGSMVGLGIYHVDTGVWEWEGVPPEVAPSTVGFDENAGLLVGMGKRSAPYATYLYKYGGAIRPLPVAPPLPVVQTTAILSESFDRPPAPGLGPDQPWTIVEGKLKTEAGGGSPVPIPGGHAEFEGSPPLNPLPTDDQLVWSSARVERDLPSPDMEAWLTNRWLEGGGGYLHEITECAAARFSPSSATYYAVCLGIGEGKHLRIVRVVNGVRTILDPNQETSTPIGDQPFGAEIRIRVTGSNPVVISAFYRGSLLSQVTDSSAERIVSGARAGIAGQGSVGVRANMDDWRAGVAAVTP